MKKSVCFLLIFAALFMLSACFDDETQNDIYADSSPSQNQTILDEPDDSIQSNEPAESNDSLTPVHTHTFSNATCTEPAKCSCGHINGNSLGHNFGDATCISASKCSRCGTTNGNAKGHNWVAASYDAPKTCSVCKITEGSPLTVPNSENYHGHVYTGGSSSKKYHYEANCAGKNSHEITWDDVSKRNLGPCGTCVLK